MTRAIVVVDRPRRSGSKVQQSVPQAIPKGRQEDHPGGQGDVERQPRERDEDQVSLRRIEQPERLLEGRGDLPVEPVPAEMLAGGIPEDGVPVVNRPALVRAPAGERDPGLDIEAEEVVRLLARQHVQADVQAVHHQRREQDDGRRASPSAGRPGRMGKRG